MCHHEKHDFWMQEQWAHKTIMSNPEDILTFKRHVGHCNPNLVEKKSLSHITTLPGWITEQDYKLTLAAPMVMERRSYKAHPRTKKDFGAANLDVQV